MKRKRTRHEDTFSRGMKKSTGRGGGGDFDAAFRDVRERGDRLIEMRFKLTRVSKCSLSVDKAQV